MIRVMIRVIESNASLIRISLFLYYISEIHILIFIFILLEMIN
jgi:hypothetical protein